MRRFLGFIAASLALLGTSAARAEGAAERWAVYYGDKLSADAFLPYDVIVFDGDHHPPLRPLQHRGKILLAYLSMGEAETYRPFFPRLKALKLLLEPNPHWKGHYVIDLRNPAWTALVIEELIPAMIREGFDGIMLDTADSPLLLESKHPRRYAGMRDAAVGMIKAIRMHYPELKLMLNRGFELLPEVAGDVTMVMAENIRTETASEKSKPTLVGDDEYMQAVTLLKAAQQRAPHLKVYTLDYWPPEEPERIKSIYAEQRGHGFIPYVSTPELQALHPEPQ